MYGQWLVVAGDAGASPRVMIVDYLPVWVIREDPRAAEERIRRMTGLSTRLNEHSLTGYYGWVEFKEDPGRSSVYLLKEGSDEAALVPTRDFYINAIYNMTRDCAPYHYI